MGIKRDEREQPGSCWNKAEEDEPIFVIRAKDVAAISTVLHWINRRIVMGLNDADDTKTKGAIEWCNIALAWRRGKGQG